MCYSSSSSSSSSFSCQSSNYFRCRYGVCVFSILPAVGASVTSGGRAQRFKGVMCPRRRDRLSFIYNDTVLQAQRKEYLKVSVSANFLCVFMCSKWAYDGFFPLSVFSRMLSVKKLCSFSVISCC